MNWRKNEHEESDVFAACCAVKRKVEVEIWLLSDYVKRKLNNAENQTGDLDSWKLKRCITRKVQLWPKLPELFIQRFPKRPRKKKLAQNIWKHSD